MHPPLSNCRSYDRLGGVRTAQMLSNLCLVGACAPEARRTSDHVFARREGMKVFLEGVPRNRGARGCGDYERPPMARRSSEPHPWGLFGQAKRNKVAPIKHHQSKHRKLRENGQNFLKNTLTHTGVLMYHTGVPVKGATAMMWEIAQK